MFLAVVFSALWGLESKPSLCIITHLVLAFSLADAVEDAPHHPIHGEGKLRFMNMHFVCIPERGLEMHWGLDPHNKPSRWGVCLKELRPGAALLAAVAGVWAPVCLTPKLLPSLPTWQWVGQGHCTLVTVLDNHRSSLGCLGISASDRPAACLSAFHTRILS